MIEKGENYPHRQTSYFSFLTCFAPPHRKAVPSPYEQGESAIRNAKNRVNLSNLLVYSYLKNLFTITTPQ